MKLAPGAHTTSFVARFNKLKIQRVNKAKSSKKRRIELVKKREALRKRTENSEGINCESNYCINLDNIKVVDTPISLSSDNSDIVYFGLETTIKDYKDLQKLFNYPMCNNQTFNAYINLIQYIFADATKVTGLHKVEQLYLGNEKLETIDLRTALEI